jgi:hypothetical protein
MSLLLRGMIPHSFPAIANQTNRICLGNFKYVYFRIVRIPIIAWQGNYMCFKGLQILRMPTGFCEDEARDGLEFVHGW